MTERNTRANVGDQRLKRHIGTIGLLFTAVGSIIGSGWLFGALEASKMAGPASIIAWVIGAVMILFIGLTYAELGTMFPMSGGVVRFPHFTHGSFASYTVGWLTWLGAASTAPVEVEAALQYTKDYIPWLQHKVDGVAVLTTPGLVVAIGMMAVFSLINVVGIRWFARLNNALVWWKLAIIALVIICFLSADFTPAHFSTAVEGGFFPFGWHGVFASISTAGVVFSYLGFRQGVELAGETDNPKRNVPLAVIGSIVICALIYVALQVAFIGALPADALSHGWAYLGTVYKDLTFGPLSTLAGTLGLVWLAKLLYIDAVVSPADTGLIFTTVTTRLSYAAGRNGNAPASLAKVNQRGVPWVSVILTFVVGIIFFLPFPGWAELVGFVVSATVLSFGSGPPAFLALRRELPNYKRPFHLAGGIIIPFLAFVSANLIVYWTGWNKVKILMLAVLVGFVVLAIHEALYHKHTPRLDLRAGFWVIPWLLGLTIISWLGNYPTVDAQAVQSFGDNQGLLTDTSSSIVIALFSAAILWLAYYSRLPAARIHALLQSHHEDESAQVEV